MTRGAKQFVYGFVYLFIFGLLLYRMFGGSGAASESGLPAAQDKAIPIAVQEPIQLFKSSDLSRIILLAGISNKNAEYGARKLDYTFTLYDGNGARVDQVRGSDAIFPGESKFLLSSYEGTSYNIGRASRADLSLSPEWVPRSVLLEPHLAVDGRPTTTVASDGIKVEGSIRNTSPLSTGTVKVTVLLYNTYDDPVFGGQTLLERIGSLSSVPFSVYIPPDPALVGRIDGSRTRVFVSAEE